MISVRPATHADLPWLLTQLREFDTFYGASMFKTVEAAEQKIAFLVGEALFLIAEDSRPAPVGFIAGFIAPDFLTDELRLNELFWWVTADARNSRAGMILLNAFRAHGKAAGCVRNILSRLPHTPLKADTLARLGFTEGETSWWEWAA